MFERYPDIEVDYQKYLELTDIYNKNTVRGIATGKLTLWYSRVEEMGISHFRTVVETMQNNYLSVLNYFEKEVQMLRLSHSALKLRLLGNSPEVSEIYNFYVLVSENLCLKMKNNKKYGLILNYNKKRINNTVTLLDVGKILNQTETENNRNRFEWKIY